MVYPVKLVDLVEALGMTAVPEAESFYDTWYSLIDHNDIGHSCIDHNYIDHSYTGHKFVRVNGHSYLGHIYVGQARWGHNYTGSHSEGRTMCCNGRP